MAKQLWSIKYRPKTLDEYIFKDESHRALIEKWIADKSLPNLLLKGHRGTGKTALVLLLKDLLGIDDSDFMSKNASDENSVNVIRTDIKNFVSTFSFGDFKVVFLDEADRLSAEAQDSLKAMMLDYSDNARFILACNKPQKIIPELKSRCQEIEYKTLDKDVMLERAAVILKTEKVKSTLDNLELYIDAYYPDFRKIIESLDQNNNNGVLAAFDDASQEISDYQFKVVEMIETNNYAGVREAVSAVVSDDEWDEVYRFMYDNLHELGKFNGDFDKWRQGIVIIANHLYRHTIVADPEINAAAMFLQLGEI